MLLTARLLARAGFSYWDMGQVRACRTPFRAPARALEGVGPRSLHKRNRTRRILGRRRAGWRSSIAPHRCRTHRCRAHPAR
eukprot:1726531-Prymnesium_polylepis.1